MYKEQLTLLLALQEVDSEIDRLKHNYATLDPGRAEATTYAGTKTAHEQAKQTLTKTKTNVQDAELERKSIQDKRKTVETKLYSGTVTAPKEMVAIQEEIAMFDRQLQTLDEKLIQLMTALEAQTQTEVTTKKARAAAAAAYKAKQDEYKTDTEKLQAEAKKLVTKRKKATAAVTMPTLLARYTTIRDTKGGVAIAAIVDNNACGGCHMGLPSALVTLVRDGREIYTCQNCRRILCEAVKVEK